MIIKAEELTTAIVTHLKNALDTEAIKRVGDHDLPDNGGREVPLPHCILYASTAGHGQGSMDNAEEDRDFIFRIKQVGRGRQQVQWMSDQIVELMTQRKIDIGALSGGLFAGNVQWVRIDSIGSIVTTGETLFESTNSYRVRAGK